MSLDYFGQSSCKEVFNGLDLVYSCDKIVLTGKFQFGTIERMLGFMKELSFHSSITREFPWGYELANVRFYEKVSVMTYRNNFVLEFLDESKEKVSFYFAVGFNAVNGFAQCWKLEFNPNKVLVHCEHWMRDFLLQLKSCSKVGGLTHSIELKSMDFAIDFPVARDSVLYDKGNRKHCMIALSLLNRTDYYGDRKQHGHTRVYNKAMESGLRRDLTRLEVTLEVFDFDSVRHYFEGLRILRHGQMAMEELGAELKPNDRVFLELLNMHPDYLSRLSYEKRKKFKPYLVDFVQPFQLDLKAYKRIYGWTSFFMLMDIGRIFGDGQ